MGAATLAAQQNRWSEALHLWSLALQRFPDRSQPIWRLGLARAMARLGLADDAAACLRTTMELHPDELQARLFLAQLLDSQGDLTGAMETLEQRLELCLTHVPTQFQVLKLMSRRGRNADAAALAWRLIESADSFDPLPGVVRMLPEICEGETLARRLAAAHTKLQSLWERNAINAGQAPIARELGLRLMALQHDHSALTDAIAATAPDDLPTLAHAAWTSFSQAVTLGFRESIDSPKLFGIGLSKTATSSLTVALELLGLRTAHYQNPLTAEILDVEQCRYFDGCFDTPISNLFETLYHTFPQSRFLYTVRPLPSWLESLRNHHRGHFGTSDWQELRALTATAVGPSATLEAALYFNHPDALSAWQAHDARVRRFFADKPSERFLAFDVFAGHGWAELCAFLQLPVPPLPFPHENKVR